MTRLRREAIAGIFTISLMVASDGYGGSSSYLKSLAHLINTLPAYIALDKKGEREFCYLGNQKDKNVFRALASSLSFKEVRYVTLNNLDASCDYLYSHDKNVARKALLDKELGATIFLSNYASFIDEGGAIAVLDDHGVLSIQTNYGYFVKRGISIDADLLDVSSRVVK